MLQCYDVVLWCECGMFGDHVCDWAAINECEGKKLSLESQPVSWTPYCQIKCFPRKPIMTRHILKYDSFVSENVWSSTPKIHRGYFMTWNGFCFVNNYHEITRKLCFVFFLLFFEFCTERSHGQNCGTITSKFRAKESVEALIRSACVCRVQCRAHKNKQLTNIWCK